MVATSDTPLLLLDGDLLVVGASQSLCDAFGIDCTAVTGKPIFAMGKGEWDLPRLHSSVQFSSVEYSAVQQVMKKNCRVKNLDVNWISDQH